MTSRPGAFPHTLLPLTLIAATLPAQRPDTAAKSGVTRLQVEATFLGGAPEAEAIELNGQVLRLADLRRNEAGDDVGPRGAMEQFVLAALRQDLERRGAWLADEQYEAAIFRAKVEAAIRLVEKECDFTDFSIYRMRILDG